MSTDNLLKKCSKCKVELGLDRFSRHKTCAGGIRNICKDCIKKSYKPKSKEKACEHSKKWRDKNKAKQTEIWNKYYSKNKESIKANARERNKLPQEKARRSAYENRNKARINKNKRARRRNMKPHQILEARIRQRFRKVVIRMKKGVKFCSPLKLIGCTVIELKAHIESQFKPGMNWQNYGNGEGKWNIDHIRPLHTYDLNVLDEQYMAFHYTNLRPLWSLDNFKRPENKKGFYERAKSIIT